jgi:RHH-type rel operon transcriptional repressor/antitoxin RelB
MAVSVRMDPLLERELELVAKRQGVTKSQFIIDAVERALGRKNPYDLMLSLKAEEAARVYDVSPPEEEAKADQPYETEAARAAVINKLKGKHFGGSTR